MCKMFYIVTCETEHIVQVIQHLRINTLLKPCVMVVCATPQIVQMVKTTCYYNCLLSVTCRSLGLASDGCPSCAYEFISRRLFLLLLSKHSISVNCIFLLGCAIHYIQDSVKMPQYSHLLFIVKRFVPQVVQFYKLLLTLRCSTYTKCCQTFPGKNAITGYKDNCIRVFQVF